MDNRIRDQRSENSFKIPTSRPLSSPENRTSYRYPLAHRYSAETDPRIPFFVQTDTDRTLETAFSGLNLSQSPFLGPRLGADFGFVDPPLGADFGYLDPLIDYLIDDEDLLPLSFQEREQTDLNLRRSRVQNEVSGQMGFEGAPGNPTAGAESFLYHPNQPAVVGDPWYGNDYANSPCELHQMHDESSLQRKQQFPRQINTQFPIMPCSCRNDLMIDSNQGNMLHNLNSLRPMLDNLSLHRMPRPSGYLSVEDCLTLKDLRGRVVFWAKDQYGHKFLQTKLENPNEEDIEMILSEVIDYVGDLMQDQYGKKLIQKLVKVCNEEWTTRIILSVTKTQFQLISICLNPNGREATLELLENITTPQQISLVMSALSPGTVTLANDSEGGRVIQYCLTHFSNEDNKHVLNEIADNCFGIAIDKSGCCVLQLCLDHSQGEFRERLVSEIIANALHLAEDPYGNYVVQHLLELKIPDVTKNLLRQLEGCYVTLSCNKYASNVVEKCLTESGEEHSTRIIMELLRSPNASRLLMDPFGNFVIQSAFSVSKGIFRSSLLDLVRLNASSLRCNLYGKKVLRVLTK
ncbi:hypothetical protein F0562_027600 [Nyssa sinensis]|uniref:PUM-HD domain-containing protein n=1 Tax=Nyssa sinensis TaxID=561372 RepID=A0A5J5B5D6_9ASTE|nr:hypothetical protein F0562_027600 [Nyssa sinensis]